jgi:SAM-dependent methyltransferase
MKTRRDGAATVPPGGVSPNGAPSAGGPEVRPSQLLPLLLERFDPEEPVTVLDVGYGSAATVAFFSGYRCRLHFAGIIDAAELNTLPDEGVDAYLDEAFGRLLGFADETCFDVCLLWDFLNYLPVPALRSFSRVLRPHLHRQTHAHGFGSFNATAPAIRQSAPETALQYGVYDVDKLLVGPRPEAPAPGFSHSRAVLADALGCFEIVRGTLLKEGTMELLLQAR